MIKNIYICDICKEENIEDKTEAYYQVVFMTEQDEWRAVRLHLAHFKFHTCKLCKEKLLEWQAIYWKWDMQDNYFSFNKFW